MQNRARPFTGLIFFLLGVVGGCSNPEESANRIYVEANQLAGKADETAKSSYAEAYQHYEKAASMLDSIPDEYPGTNMAVKVINDEVTLAGRPLSKYRDQILPRYKKLAALETDTQKLTVAWAEYALDRAGAIAENMLQDGERPRGAEESIALMLAQSYLDSAMLLLESERYKGRYDQLADKLDALSYRGLGGGAIARLTADRHDITQSVAWPYVLSLNASLARRTGDHKLAEQLARHILEIYTRISASDPPDEERLVMIIALPRVARVLIQAGFHKQVNAFLDNKTTSLEGALKRIRSEVDLAEALQTEQANLLWLPAVTMALAWTDNPKQVASLIRQIREIAEPFIQDMGAKEGGKDGELVMKMFDRGLSIMVARTRRMAGLSRSGETLTPDDKQLLRKMVREEPDEAWFLYYVTALQGFPALALDAQQDSKDRQIKEQVRQQLMLLSIPRALDMADQKPDQATTHRLVELWEQQQ